MRGTQRGREARGERLREEERREGRVSEKNWQGRWVGIREGGEVQTEEGREDEGREIKGERD